MAALQACYGDGQSRPKLDEKRELYFGDTKNLDAGSDVGTTVRVSINKSPCSKSCPMVMGKPIADCVNICGKAHVGPFGENCHIL